MTFSPFDSPIYSVLYGDTEVRALFTDSAEVRAMLLVEGTLAKVQGELGIIPLESSLYIHRASMEVQVDPAGLAAGMAETGSPVPAMVAAFSKAMEAPEHAKYIHRGANSQDTMDTALVLRLRQYARLLDTRLDTLVNTLMGNTHAASLAQLRQRLTELQTRLLVVRFAGASDDADLGDKKQEIEVALAKALRLSVPADSSHSAREVFVELALVISLITETLGEMGQGFPQSMHTEVLATMALFNINQAKQIHHALTYAQEQNGVALALERLTLGQMCIAGGVALKHALTLAEHA